MSYSCCYVLTDSKELRFYNQMMVSVSSLRYTGFTGGIYVITDMETEQFLQTKRPELAEMSAEIVSVDIQGDYSQKEKSRYLKTSLRKYIDGDVLYIDTDTILAASLPEAISDSELAMAQDRNGLDDRFSYQWHKDLFDKCGLEIPKDLNWFFNSGVIWMRDTLSVHHFFDEWHPLWKQCLSKGVVNDQLSMNCLWKRDNTDIVLLDNRFNVQIGQDFFSPLMLKEAYILHLFNGQIDSPVFYLLDSNIQQLDYRSEGIQSIIHNPLAAFSSCKWFSNNSIVGNYMETDTFSFGLYLFRKHPHIYSLLEHVFHMFRSLKSRHIR